MKERIDSTDAAQKFYESEDYQKLQKLRQEAKEFRADLSDQIDASQSPVVQKTS